MHATGEPRPSSAKPVEVPLAEPNKKIPFSPSAMHKSVQLALAKLNAHRATLKQPALAIRPYDFRHSFGTWVADHIVADRERDRLWCAGWNCLVTPRRWMNDSADYSPYLSMISSRLLPSCFSK